MPVGNDQEREGEGARSAGVCGEVKPVFIDEETIVRENNVARSLVLDESNTVLDLPGRGTFMHAAKLAHYVYYQRWPISMF